jgi:hypothetical protein
MAEPTLSSIDPADVRAAEIDVLLVDPAAIARRQYRGYPRPYSTRFGIGSSDTSHEALQMARALTFECSCGALVQWLSAKRRACEAGRDELEDGDGCSSAACSHSHVRTRFNRRQRLCAQRLLDGGRLLITKPQRRSTERVRLRTTVDTQQVANDVLGA